MQRIHQKVGRTLFGALAISFMLTACNNQVTPEPNPQPKPGTNPGTKPEEKTMLTFKVKSLKVNSTDKGFRVYSTAQQVQVAVAKGKTTASKSAVIEAIKAKDSELEELENLQLYKADKTNAPIYFENDEALKNNANVFVGKDDYTKKVTITLQSVKTAVNSYGPVADYAGGKQITVSVNHDTNGTKIAQELQAAIKNDVRGGSNYDLLYKLFSSAAGAHAYDRHFVEGATIYIGKKVMKPTVTLKNINGGTYFGVFKYSKTKLKNDVVHAIEADDNIADTANASEMKAMFEEKITAYLQDEANGDNGGAAAAPVATNKLSLLDFFADAAAKRPVTDEIYLKGGTIYVGIKEAKLLTFDVVSITKDATAVVAAADAKPTVPANTPTKKYIKTDDEKFQGNTVISFTTKLYGSPAAPNENIVAAKLMAEVKKLVPEGKKFALFKQADASGGAGATMTATELTAGGIAYIGIEED